MCRSRAVSTMLKILLLLCCGSVQPFLFPSDSFNWTDPDNSVAKFACPRKYRSDELGKTFDADVINELCRCASTATWKYFPKDIEYLQLEYNGRLGKGRLLSLNTLEWNTPQAPLPINRPQGLVHKDGFLNSFPENMCDFQNIVKLDLSGNNLLYIGSEIRCLSCLYELILRQNKITKIANTTFHGMSSLRALDISYNAIVRIDPGTLSDSSLSLCKMDFSFNQLTEIDVTNMITPRHFVEIKLNNNAIQKLVNELHIILQDNVTYGDGGRVDLENNKFHTFINFTDIGVTDLTQIGKMFGYGFDLRGANFSCDCIMEPFLELSLEVIHKIWRNYFDVKCASPPELADMSIPDLLREERFDSFICDISKASDNCPSVCECYRQPSQDRTVVNCTHRNLTKLPKNIPGFDNIHLLLEGNEISDLTNVSYINQLAALDVSFNDIKTISEDVAKLFSKEKVKINLEENSMMSISSAFISRDPCSLHLGVVYVECNCNNDWIRSWLYGRNNNVCKNKTDVFCKVGSEHVHISEFDFTSLECNTNWTLRKMAIAGTAMILLLCFVLGIIFHFRYEVYLLLKNPQKWRYHQGEFIYDAYVSIRENNMHVHSWVMNVLIPSLEKSKYSVYFRPKDALLGAVQEEDIIDKITHSRNQIVILSADYTNHDHDHIWTQIEWKHTWNKFKENSHIRNIIVINFDQLRSKEFEVGPMKAFLGLGLALDFSNRKHQLLDEIKHLLGMPNSSCATRNYGWLASKPRFSSQVSFSSLKISPEIYFNCKDNFEDDFFKQNTFDNTRNFQYKSSCGKKEIEVEYQWKKKYGNENNIDKYHSSSTFNEISEGNFTENKGFTSFTRYRAPEEIDIRV